MVAKRSQQVDPVTFSVLLNRLNSITSEMTVALANTASSALLALTQDFSCCIYDARGRQVAMKDGFPIHTNSMHLFIEAILSYFGEDIHEGDLIACNYPYAGNTHIGDLATAYPVFHEGRVVFWTAVRAHQLDVGAPEPTSAWAAARDVWQEGLKIPPIKLYDAGVLRRDLIDLYLVNMRWPELLKGDLMAQLGATAIGGRKCKELCAEHGSAMLEEFVEQALDYAARRTIAEIRAMPNGEYRGESWLDFDADPDREVAVRCVVRIEDDTIDVSFDGSSPQVDRALNATAAVMQAAGGIPIIMAIDPDIPHNEGCLRRVRISAPLGTIANAAYPAATALATVLPGDVMQECVSRALALAIPDKASAAHARWSNCPMLSGFDERFGGTWAHQPINGGGGGGAAAGTDGWPLITASASWGAFHCAPIEHTELLYPVLVDEWEVEPESMGMGEFIGGPGIRFTLRPTGGQMDVIYASDGLKNPPAGLVGGTAGAGGGAFIQNLTTGQRRFLPSEVNETISPAETWTGISSGGGGYGGPLNRDAELVRRDVRDGLYTRKTAIEVFGVVLSDDTEVSLDRPATEKLRDFKRQKQTSKPVALPDKPRASQWLQKTMREQDTYVAFAGPTSRPT